MTKSHTDEVQKVLDQAFQAFHIDKDLEKAGELIDEAYRLVFGEGHDRTTH